jgi:3-oxoacyl-[acyl-carrier protein] reductase
MFCTKYSPADSKMKLDDRVAIITGVAGPQGMGYATAKKLAEDGAILVIADISSEVNERAKELENSGFNVTPFKLDLTRSSEVKSMVDDVLKNRRHIDILANIAGIGPRGSAETGGLGKRFVDLSEQEWQSQLDINLKTTYNCTKAVLPIMINQNYGRIINMSSVTGPLVSNPGTSAYSAAKGAVSALTKALALEVAEYRITVNAVAPGWIHTGSSRPSELKASLATPMRRAGEPSEVANLISFLASDESSYITGHNIVIDGGNILQEDKAAA